MKKIIAGAALLVATGPAWAGSLDLSLSNETANLIVTLDSDPFDSRRDLEVDGGAEVALGAFISEVGDKLVHATLLARGITQTLNSQYQISAGMKLIGGEIEVGDDREASSDSETVGALALGAQVGFLLLPSVQNPIELSVEGFYAPNITSFSHAERYGEVGAKLQVEIMPRARAYIGYRRIRFDTDEYENIRLDRSAHVGLNISF